MKYKIDGVTVKEFEIKFLARLENGKTFDLTRIVMDEQDADTVNAYWEFSDCACVIFGRDGNLSLSDEEKEESK
tara:strand:+ start:72 stop:293 length:222 start_codon:yes stop_codon:yes gene_type:complete